MYTLVQDTLLNVLSALMKSFQSFYEANHGIFYNLCTFSEEVGGNEVKREKKRGKETPKYSFKLFLW